MKRFFCDICGKEMVTRYDSLVIKINGGEEKHLHLSCIGMSADTLEKITNTFILAGLAGNKAGRKT